MRRACKTVPKQRLNFYDNLSCSNLNYADFKENIIKRMKVLKALESTYTIDDLLQINSPEVDIMTHFCTRLMCAQTLWSAKWFLKLETILFDKRLQSFSDENVYVFFYENLLQKLHPIKILSEKKQIEIPFESSYDPDKSADTQLSGYRIKLHFRYVIDMISSFDIDPIEGYVYLNPRMIRSLVSTFFRKFLEKEVKKLNNICKYQPDERLMKIHEEFHSQAPRKPRFSINIQKDEKKFPPCIAGLISKLRDFNHLKYRDRLVLARFFKDSGMSVDDSIEFFKKEFKGAKLEDIKHHIYTIRHTYGLEGSRKSYHAYNCAQIIAFGKEKDAYGCPFDKNKDFIRKYYEHNHLENQLIDIEQLFSTQSYQKACACTLKKIVDNSDFICESVTSPVDYVEALKNLNKK